MDVDLFRLLWEVYNAPARSYFGERFYYSEDHPEYYVYAVLGYGVFLMVLHYWFHGRDDLE